MTYFTQAKLPAPKQSLLKCTKYVQNITYCPPTLGSGLEHADEVASLCTQKISSFYYRQTMVPTMIHDRL